MIKLFILVISLEMPWPCDCGKRDQVSSEVVQAQCETRSTIRPQVTFHWDADSAAKRYMDVAKPDRARLFSVTFSVFSRDIEVKELNVAPAQTYEIIRSSVIARQSI